MSILQRQVLTLLVSVTKNMMFFCSAYILSPSLFIYIIIEELPKNSKYKFSTQMHIYIFTLLHCTFCLVFCFLFKEL